MFSVQSIEPLIPQQIAVVMEASQSQSQSQSQPQVQLQLQGNNPNPNANPNPNVIRSSVGIWPTIDGPLGLSEEESMSYARRFYKFGFALLPLLWAVNCFYFWPVLRHSHSFPRIRPCAYLFLSHFSIANLLCSLLLMRCSAKLLHIKIVSFFYLENWELFICSINV